MEEYEEYVQTNWQDYPSRATPIDAASLNKLEQTLGYNVQFVNSIRRSFSSANLGFSGPTQIEPNGYFDSEVDNQGFAPESVLTWSYTGEYDARIFTIQVFIKERGKAIFRVYNNTSEIASFPPIDVRFKAIGGWL